MISQTCKNYKRKEWEISCRRCLSSRGKTNFNYRSFIKHLKTSPAFPIDTTREKTTRPEDRERQRRIDEGQNVHTYSSVHRQTRSICTANLARIRKPHADQMRFWARDIIHLRTIERMSRVPREAFRNSSTRCRVVCTYMCATRLCGKTR